MMVEKLAQQESKSVIVTGGAGYIGAHCCKALAKAGYYPITVDNLVKGHQEAVRWGPLEQGDIGDREFMASLFSRYRPISIMHFAAFTAVGESVQRPELYYQNNFVKSLTLLEAAIAANVKNIVFSSTCATYGNSETLPIDERVPQLPVNPYGWSKKMTEQVMIDFAHAHGLRTISLRYFNAAGADPDGEIGLRNETTLLIPLAIRAALGKGKELKVFGTDYNTRDGTGIRDYIHVTDLAEAHILALARLVSKSSDSPMAQSGLFEAYNLGTGDGHTVFEVLAGVDRALRDLDGETAPRKVPYKITERRAGDPPALFADPSRARLELGWHCSHSDLKTIVDSALNWENKLHNQ